MFSIAIILGFLFLSKFEVIVVDAIQKAPRGVIDPGGAYFTKDFDQLCFFSAYSWGGSHESAYPVFGMTDDLKNALQQLELFPVEDGRGYFIYFDENAQIIGQERFSDAKGKVRWRRQGDRKFDEFCASRADLVLEVFHGQGYSIIEPSAISLN